jgi:chemotaxis-related protein WspB
MRALRFQVLDRALAVDLRHVHEVCPAVRLKPVPAAPAWLAGLLDYHGQLLPAVDASVLLGGDPVPLAVGTRILLMRAPTQQAGDAPMATFGLVVHAVDGVLDVDHAECWTTRDGLPGLPFLTEVAQGDRRGVLVLDATRLAALHAGLLTGPAVLARTSPSVAST